MPRKIVAGLNSEIMMPEKITSVGAGGVSWLFEGAGFEG
jgi:hypothetical protein